MMPPARTGTAMLALVLLASGCAGSSSPASRPEPTDATLSSTMPEGTPVGELWGVVTDDELVPLGGAIVAVPKLGVEARAEADGAYRLTSVPVGRATVQAVKPGYSTLERIVNVANEGKTRADFALERIADVVPTHQTKRTEVMITLEVGAVANHPLGQPHITSQCTGCAYNVEMPGNVWGLLVEVTGSNTLPNAVTGTQASLLVRAWNHTTYADVIPSAVRPVPVRAESTHIPDAIQGAFRYFHQVRCDPTWVCAQERRTVFSTFFFGQGIVEGFTATNPG